MLLECLCISCIYGISPFVENHILKFIGIETFMIICALLFFMLISVYFTQFHTHNIYKDVAYLNQNYHLYGYIVLFVVAFYIVGTYLYLHVLKNNKPHLVSTLTAIYPMITLFFAFLFFEEQINLYQFIGIIMIVLGIATIEMNK